MYIHLVPIDHRRLLSLHVTHIAYTIETETGVNCILTKIIGTKGLWALFLLDTL